MDTLEVVRVILESHGLAELGLYQEAWDGIESLPPEYRTRPQAVAVRLLICAGLQKWEMGTEIVRLIGAGNSIMEREAAGQFHLAHAESLCAAGDIAAAKKAVRSLATVWREGRERALNSQALAAVWT